MSSRWIVPAVIIAALAGTPAIAQKFVYPAKGQSPEQQKKDEYECYTWAAQQSGYDPTKAPPPQAAAPSQPAQSAGAAPGSGVRGAARGAVVGGAVGNIGDVDSSDAARTGAAVGAVRGRQKSREQAQQQQAQQQQQAAQQQSAANAAGPEAYAKARTACLTGRGYTVN